MSEFSDRPFVAGSLVGLRAFAVDSLGRLTGPAYGGIFKPGDNEAECLKSEVGPMWSLLSTYNDDMYRRSLGLPARKKEKPQPPPEPAPHALAGIGCACGYYAYFDGRNDYKNSERIAAIVEGFGVCTVGTRGFRASKARLVALVVPGKRFPEARFALVTRNYPDVPFYESRAAAVEAHPLSEGIAPSPDEPDFWTRSAS